MEFNGILNYADGSFHSYVSDSQNIMDFGTPAYTAGSIKKYLEDESVKNGNPDKVNFTIEKLTGQANCKKYYWKFDEVTGEYKKEELDEGEDLVKLTEDHDKIQLNYGAGANEEDSLAIIKQVQKSLTGCIHFTPFGEDESTEIRLYFQHRSHSGKKRKLSINGDPLVSTVPRTATGKKYHSKATKERKVFVDEEKNAKTRVGHFKIQEGGKYLIDDEDLDARLASKLRLSYNDGLGYYESGTQVVLARLLQDVDPAPISAIDLSVMDGLDQDSLYNPDSPYFMSQFTTGVALPLSIHDGNPHTFGPNIINSTNNKKEKIRVVNRAAKKFKQNDVVLCLLIGSEWIILDFGEQQQEPPGVKLGKWSFTKMMVNSDGFLQDIEGKELVAEDAYSIRMKSKFYTDLNAIMFNDDVLSELNDIPLTAKLNAAPTQQLADVNVEEATMPDMTDILFKPTDKYIQASSFDMVGDNMGGNNSHGNIIGRTNRVISNNTADQTPVEYIRDMGVWWGPLFTEGFASSKTLSIKETAKDVSYHGIDSFFGGSDSLNLSAGNDKSTTGGIFDDRLDFNFYQMPADIGTNSSPQGQNGRPIESISLLTKYELQDNLPKAYDDYRNSVERFSWISTDESGDESFYDLEPVTKNKLQLIPMAWSMPSGESIQVVSGIDVGSEHLLWGKMFERESEHTPYTFDDGVPWDLQVENRPKGRPYGVEYTFRDTDPRGEDYDGANLIAITAGRNTVRIGGGASLQFDASYNYGLPKWTTTTGGQVTPPTILPIGGGIAFGGGTNAIRTYGFPQWGSSSTAFSQLWGGSQLKVKVYDHWPEEDTIYDVRYFQPLHFCSGRLGTAADTEILDEGIELTDEVINNYDPKSTIIAGIRYTRTVDKQENDVDFRIPTYAHPIEEDLDNSAVPVGQLINSKGVGTSSKTEDTVSLLRVPEEWRVNTICRGMMVDENFGFRYMKRVIGINPDDFTVINAGEGFATGMIFDAELTDGIIIEIGETDNGSLTEGSIIVKDKGHGLLPSRFNRSFSDNEEEPITGLILSIGTAQIMFHTGIVYDRLEETRHPNKQGSVGALPKSDGEAGVLMGSKSTTIGISKPNTTNLYDIFFFYGNDVGHVDLVAQPQTVGFIQYVDFDIGAA